MFVSDLQQVDKILQTFLFPPPIYLTTMIGESTMNEREIKGSG